MGNPAEETICYPNQIQKCKRRSACGKFKGTALSKALIVSQFLTTSETFGPERSNDALTNLNYYSGISLIHHLRLREADANRVAHKPRDIMYIKTIHQKGTMRFHGFGTHLEHEGDFLGAFTLSD
ncbi:MAG: hypothetical protein JWM16_2847 [Verrucomicrobiales bacterium]|nr:hypothetical protein [Verrucomicrobiales bacterium]